jgi:hypothetical protein
MWAVLYRGHVYACKGGIDFHTIGSTDYLFNASVSEWWFDSVQVNPCINITDAAYIMVDKCFSAGNVGAGLSVTGACTQITVSNCNFGSYSGHTAPALQILTGPNGNPNEVFLSTCVFQGGNYAGQITAGNGIFINNCEFVWAQFHGLYFNGSMGQVIVSGCRFTTNAGTVGANYDLLWSGSGTIIVSECIFGTFVNPTQTAGYVIACASFTSGTSIVCDNFFINIGTGSAYGTRPTYSVNNYNDDVSNFRVVKVGGIAGTTNATRYVGATGGGGPPGAGTFAVGDFVVDPQGQIYICTVAGSPGTWIGTGPYTAFASANPNYTVPNDNARYNIVGAAVTINVQPGWEVLVNWSSFGTIMEGNTTAHAVLSVGLNLDGATSASPAGYLTGRSASIGYAGMISYLYKFTGLSAGNHTFQLICQWNGLANQALIQQSAISATASRSPM